MNTITFLAIDPITAEVRGLSEEARRVLDAELSFYAKGYKYDWRVKAGRWDGEVHLLSGDRLPAGLVPRAARVLTERGFPVDPGAEQGITRIFPGRGPLNLSWNDADPGPLREYQRKAFWTAQAHGRGIIWMGTGTGKTEVLAALVAVYSRRALIIVPTKELLHQTAERLHRRLPTARIGLLGDSHHRWETITVGLFPTIARNLKEYRTELAEVEVLISDEAHHAASDTWLSVLMACPAPYRFGFSATPVTDEFRKKKVGERVITQRIGGHGLLLEGATGPVIYTYRGQEAVEDGTLTPPRVFLLAPTTPERDRPSDGTKNWTVLEQQGIVDNTVRNQALAETAAELAASWGPTLVIVGRVDHGRDLADRIAAFGRKVAFLDGTTTSTFRRQVLRDFGKRRYDVVVSTKLLDEGVDVPVVSAVVLAGGGKAAHKVIQRVGRGMRRGGADTLVVVDVDDDAHPILAHHSRLRQKVFRDEGWPVERIG